MKKTIEKLKGLKCFSANHLIGTMFNIHLGYPEVYLSDDGSEMSVEGEWGITVAESKWIINDEDHNSVSSDSPLIERKAAISDLIGRSVEHIEFISETSQLNVTFSKHVSLQILPELQEAESEPNMAYLWSLKTPSSDIGFQLNGKYDEEFEPKNVRKITMTR